MLISAFISSFVIGLFFFLLGLIFEPANNWHMFAFIVAFGVTFLITTIFGIPTVYFLRQFNKLNWITLPLTSFSLGFFICAILILIARPNGNYGNIQDGKVLVVNGITTIDGWLYHLYSCLEFGFIGVISGIIFYATYNYRIKKNIQNCDNL